MWPILGPPGLFDPNGWVVAVVMIIDLVAESKMDRNWLGVAKIKCRLLPIFLEKPPCFVVFFWCIYLLALCDFRNDIFFDRASPNFPTDFNHFLNDKKPCYSFPQFCKWLQPLPKSFARLPMQTECEQTFLPNSSLSLCNSVDFVPMPTPEWETLKNFAHTKKFLARPHFSCMYSNTIRGACMSKDQQAILQQRQSTGIRKSQEKQEDEPARWHIRHPERSHPGYLWPKGGHSCLHTRIIMYPKQCGTTGHISCVTNTYAILLSVKADGNYHKGLGWKMQSGIANQG